jgi:hypothetical protein
VRLRDQADCDDTGGNQHEPFRRTAAGPGNGARTSSIGGDPIGRRERWPGFGEARGTAVRSGRRRRRAMMLAKVLASGRAALADGSGVPLLGLGPARAAIASLRLRVAA